MDIEKTQRKKILYLTHRDAKDKREWSGTLYYMAKSLQTHAGDVVYAGPYNPLFMVYFIKAINKLSILLLRKKYSMPYNLLQSYLYKWRFTKIIRRERPDVIFAASASGEMSQLEIPQPIIYLGDITFELLKDHYPNYQNLSRFSLWESRLIEKKTFEKAAALVLSSQWAADSALKDYQSPPEKIHIIPYGANMDKVPTNEEAIQKQGFSPCRFLFLGLDWVRKGGDMVFKTFEILQQKGYDVHLTVCGCIPPPQYQNPKMTVIPFLNKNIESEEKRLFQILSETHFLFVPSRSDCTPIVFCEANAFGIPVITTNAGGIASVIEDGFNGHTLSLDANPEDYAIALNPYFKDPELYKQLVKNSRDAYNSKLNWDHWGRSLAQIIEQLTNK